MNYGLSFFGLVDWQRCEYFVLSRNDLNDECDHGLFIVRGNGQYCSKVFGRSQPWQHCQNSQKTLLQKSKMMNQPSNTTTETSPRRILMCVSGMSPAVITETLYALVTQSTPFVPDEIHVVTTLEGKVRVLNDLLTPEAGHFHRLMQDFLPKHSIRFNEDTIHVIAKDGTELSDITTDADNKAAANTLYRVMSELKGKPSTTLHASVAGGRKSMSFYMGHVFSLLAETGDLLSHVLVNEPFETVSGFYYPPKSPVTLTDRGGKTHSTSNANIKLAELSVLKLRNVVGELPKKAQQDFEFAVRLAQAALEPPELHVVLSRSKGKGYLTLCGEEVALSPLEFALFAIYAMARVHEETLPNGAGVDFGDFKQKHLDAINQELGNTPLTGQDDKLLKTKRSTIQTKLHTAVGTAAEHFKLEVAKKGDENHLVQLKSPASCLKLDGLDGLWNVLNPVLRQQA